MKKVPGICGVWMTAGVVWGLAISMLLACPAGTKTSVEAGVTATVDPTQCKEVQGDAGLAINTSSTVLLSCTNITGTGTIQVVFPRKTWWDMKLAAVPAVDAGPGK